MQLEKVLLQQPMDVATMKFTIHKILLALCALHREGIVHRDLKVQNILYTDQGELTLIDFGMAEWLKDCTSVQIMTRIYRPPEILYGMKTYGCSIDMWSLGCIMAECLRGYPYFPGSSDIEQLALIFKAIGTPEEHGWTEAQTLPAYIQFRMNPDRLPLKQQFPMLDDTGLDLLEKLLCLDPVKRISAQEVTWRCERLNISSSVTGAASSIF